MKGIQKPRNYLWFNPAKETLFDLKQGRKHVGTSYYTLLRCARKGRPSPNGEQIRLKICQSPRGMLATTLEEFERFVERISTLDEEC